MASLEISPEKRLSAIIKIAGGDTETSVYRNGTLYVEGVSQEDLDAALVTYENDLEQYLIEPARQRQNNRISLEANGYIESSYPSFRRELFIALAEEARNSGLTNRVAYINQLLTWVKTVVAETISVETAIDSETDIDVIKGYSVDFTQFDATNPNITIKGALAIED